MNKKIKYVCKSCGLEHENWPALTYSSPSNYLDLSDEEKLKIATIDDDICVIKHTDQTDRFVRCTLTQKVNDHCENLEYGLWVSLSQKSFKDYLENFNNENYLQKYFGWLCNHLPEYDDFTTSIPTTIFTRTENQRPEIIPDPVFNHPFVQDYYKGISKREAEKRIDDMLKLITKREKTSNDNKKSWWKF